MQVNDATAFAKAVAGAIDPASPEADFAALYRRAATQILHEAIRAIPNFTGRREDLGRLDAALWAGRPGGGAPAHVAAITQAAVHGLGGVGKSTLAAQYGWESRERYAGVWQLAAETETGIADGLIVLGARFIPGLADRQDRSAAARAALDFIADGGFEKPWLLIYDNAETPAALNDWTPRSGAHVLITTRWPNWHGRAAALPLGVFTPDEAVAFLLKATGRADAEGAARLAEALGHLPVALDHAAAFCAETGDNFDAYAARLTDWLREAPEAADYPRAVFATFSLAIEKAAAGCPEAELLMGLLAFMDADDFPRAIIPEGVIGAHALSKATAALARVSLVTVKPQGEGGPLLSTHRLVQAVMRARLSERGEAERVALTALRLVADAFPFESHDVRHWPACERLLPHAFALLPGAPDRGEGAEKTSQLCNQAALYLMSRADYKAAEPLLRRAITIYEAIAGHDHRLIGNFLNNLSVVLRAIKHFDEAEECLIRALKITKKELGADHPDVAIRLNNLAGIYEDQLYYNKAKRLYRQALAIREKNFDQNPSHVAQSLNNLGLLNRKQGYYGKAETLYKRAIDIWTNILGKDHPEVGTGCNNLAELYRLQQRYDEAESLYKRALVIRENALGQNHPLTRQTLDNLAALYNELLRYEDSEPLMQRALAIDEAALGPDHPSVAISLNNLARLLQDTGRLAEAEPPMRRALAICEASLGPDHPSTQIFRQNYAILQAELRGDRAG
jgi:tetratricopeptide (TPR) repeat protein